ncbi:MAG: hypothetical protein MI746_12825 [Pseudomonadales bacterium]|nr:hypothetical protein [Pseudomonadales bacterium]
MTRTLLMSVVIVVLLVGLSACRTIDLEPGFARNESIHDQIIDQTEDLFPEIDPLLLSEEIKQLVDEHVRPYPGEETRVERLQEILYGEEYLDLQYTDERTHTAIEAFELQEGNCLSAMNLYVAMARYAGVDANFQTVEVQPSWDRRGGLLVLSKHINATGRFNVQRRYVVDFTPEIALQQLTASVVSDQYARGLYFNNLGVEAMIAGDLEQAVIYFKNALFLESNLSIAWNNIGAAYNRLGNKEFAEYSYQMAFNADNTNATAINNLAKFYRLSGNIELAQEYALAIERFNNRNPYFHYARGQVAFNESDLDQAQTSFSRALRLKEEEPDFYLALADVYDARGYEIRANELRLSAQNLIVRNSEIYQPSDQKLRILDSSQILRDGAPGISIRFD